MGVLRCGGPVRLEKLVPVPRKNEICIGARIVNVVRTVNRCYWAAARCSCLPGLRLSLAGHQIARPMS